MPLFRTRKYSKHTQGIIYTNIVNMCTRAHSILPLFLHELGLLTLVSRDLIMYLAMLMVHVSYTICCVIK